jgi:LPXTG-motif cell wall-anchored protein
MISRKRILASGVAVALFLFSGTWAMAGNSSTTSNRTAGVVSQAAAVSPTIHPEPPPFRVRPTPTPAAAPMPSPDPTFTGGVLAAVASSNGAVLADTGTPIFYLVLGIALLLMGAGLYLARRRRIA